MTIQTLRKAMLVGALLPACALAQDNTARDRNPDDPTYSSFRLTQARADFDNLDPGYNLGYNFGFRLPGFELFSVELDFSSTIIPGENAGAVTSPVLGGSDTGDDGLLGDGLGGLIGGDDGDMGDSSSGESNPSTARNTRSGNELLLNTVGIFARLETPRRLHPRLFAAIRIGYSYVDSSIPELVEDSRGSESYGIGVGYRYGEGGRVELRFTQVADDLQYLGLGFSF